MKLIEKHFIDHFLRDRGPDDYFSPSDYREAFELYGAGFRKAREMAVQTCATMGAEYGEPPYPTTVGEAIEKIGEDEVKE